MLSFWDTSAIIPLLGRHEHSKISELYYKEYKDLIVARSTIVEIHSTLARLMRDKKLKKAAHNDAINILDHITSMWTTVGLSDRLFEIASQLPYTHGLTVADSIQLASALVWARETPLNIPFVSFDTRLSKAAKACGFNVISY